MDTGRHGNSPPILSRTLPALAGTAALDDNPDVRVRQVPAEIDAVFWSAILIALLSTDQSLPRFEQLESGLRVMIVEDHTLPLVSMQLWYRVGSADDPPDKPGLCAIARSILEHRDDAALKLRGAGVRFDSRTLRDACYFSSILPPNFLEYALAIEAARIRPLPVTAAMAELGLGTAAREYARQADDPDHVVLRHVLAAMFPDHPYEHPPGFIAAALSDVSPEELDAFLERWFVPGNATLFVIGDVSTVRVLEHVRQHFDGLEWAEPPRRAEPGRLPAETIRISVPYPSCAAITTAWRTPPLGYFETAAIDVLMQRLCNPVDGPLCRRLLRMQCPPPRWKRYAWRDAGLLVLCVDLTEGGGQGLLGEIEAGIEEEITKAAGSMPAEIEHIRARALARHDLLNRQAGFGNRAGAPAKYEVIAGDLLLAEFRLAQVAQVSVADVQQAALELTGERTVRLLRQKASEDRPDTTHRQSMRLLPAHHARPPAQLDGPAALELLASQASGAPRVESPTSPAIVTTHELGNQVTVTVCRVAGLKPSEVRTLLAADNSVAPALSALLAAGSTKHTPDEFRDYLSYHGLDLYPLARGVRPGLVSRGPATQVPQMIELHAELIRFPNRRDSACAGVNPLQWLDEVRAVEVLVVGDVEPQSVCQTARQAWERWQPTAQSTGQGELSYAVIPSAGRRAAPQPYTFTYRSHRFVEADHRSWLGIDDTLYPPTLAQPARELALHCVAWTLGGHRPLPTTLDAKRDWLWTWDYRGAHQVPFRAQPASDQAAPYLESWLDRMSRLQRGELPRSEVETALRLARADRLTSLGSAADIADLLERGVSNPWDLLDDHGPEQFLDLMPQVYRVHARSISGTSREDSSEEFKRFDNRHERHAGQPDSP